MESDRVGARTGRWHRRIFSLLVFFVGLAGPVRDEALAWEIGAVNDFHFSVREEFNQDKKYQVDNYFSLDAYKILGTVDFHSQFLVTNDFNLTDSEEVQLTLAYLSAERLLDRWDLAVGRQLFAEGFDAFLADGARVRYRFADSLRCSVHVEVPFDAENEVIRNEPIVVFGAGLEAEIFGADAAVPLRVSAQVERREFTDNDAPDQTLIGIEALAEISHGLDADLYADVEVETEDSRLRRVRVGSRLYPTPKLACNLEVERFDPDRRLETTRNDSFFQDTITNLFARSAIVGGSISLNYALPNNRDVWVSYAVNRYIRGRDEETFGHGVEAFLNVLSLPLSETYVGCGYNGFIVSDDTVHLGVIRAGTSPLSMMHLSLLAESGVLNTRHWDDEWILHIRGAAAFVPIKNLETSLVLEENRNPYFDSDFRVILLCRLVLGTREVLR